MRLPCVSSTVNRAFTGLGGREEPLTWHEHLTPGTQLLPMLELSLLTRSETGQGHRRTRLGTEA